MNLEYKTARNNVIRLIKKARKSTYETKIDKGKNKPSSIWKLFKEFGASRKSKVNEEILSINHADKTCTDQNKIVDAFNDLFINIAEKLKDPIPNSDFKDLKCFVDDKVQSDVFFNIPNIYIENVNKMLRDLDINKSTGLDKIGPRLLKLSAHSIAPIITFLINNSLNTSTFPSVWKEAKVKPLFKKGPSNDVNNYRPISILPTLSKLIEKHVHTAFTDFFK